MEILEENIGGVSFLCDMHGRLIEFLRDDIGISARLRPGQPFSMVFDTESIQKGFKFFSEVKSKGTAFDWELCVVIGGRCEVLHFAGYASANNIFIVGAKTRSGVLHFCDELVRINNDQANSVRSLMKDQISASREHSEREKKYYEELTRLNNELESIQRQLEKKNIEQERLNKELSATIAELERTRDQLIQSEKMASLGRLVSGFAHEINTPIGIAITASSSLYDSQQNIKRMLSQEEVEEEELVSNLDTIREASELTLSNLRRAADLVSSFKRTSIDQTAETARLFGVCEVIHDVILSLGNKFKPTGIEIRADCPEELNIFGYPGSVSQILTNFMMNSLIYGFEDGTLPGQILIHARSENNTVFFDYEDTGKGMDENVVKNLFEPFFTTRRARGGTGLGMYICYNIVKDRLNGTIECESSPGHGTRFHITFPLEKLS
jgi:signal transduction histidine kinase